MSTVTLEVTKLEEIRNLLWDSKSHLAMNLRVSSENMRASKERIPWKPALLFPQQVALGDALVENLRKAVAEIEELIPKETDET